MSQEQPPIRSRRELRRARDQRQEANRKPGTAGHGAVPPASKNSASTTPDSNKPASNTPDALAAGSLPASGALSPVKEPAEKEVNPSGGGPLTRRQLRRLQQAAEAAQPAPEQNADVSTAGPGGPGPKSMSVEQALAAREMLAQQAKNQLAKMAHINATDPDAVDPDGVAGQAALAGQNSPPEPLRSDPANASNLAMVTPLEFVRVPGVEWPVMKRPATSHVPVVTTSIPRVEQPRKSGNRPADPSHPEGWIPAPPLPDEDFDGRPPVAANTANGLEPLDADTAGLGRARRRRLVQLAVLALGVIALIAGSILIITGLSG